MYTGEGQRAHTRHNKKKIVQKKKGKKVGRGKGFLGGKSEGEASEILRGGRGMSRAGVGKGRIGKGLKTKAGRSDKVEKRPKKRHFFRKKVRRDK